MRSRGQFCPALAAPSAPASELPVAGICPKTCPARVLPQPIYLPPGWPKLSGLRGRTGCPLGGAGRQPARPCHWRRPECRGVNASLVSVVHQRPQQEAMGAKSSGGKVGRHNIVLHQPSGSSHSPLDLKGLHKKGIGFSLRFLAAVSCLKRDQIEVAAPLIISIPSLGL